MVFWTTEETFREHWVNAFRSLRTSDDEGNPGANQLEMTANNWFASQIYMFLKREYAIVNS